MEQLMGQNLWEIWILWVLTCLSPAFSKEAKLKLSDKLCLYANKIYIVKILQFAFYTYQHCYFACIYVNFFFNNTVPSDKRMPTSSLTKLLPYRGPRLLLLNTI